MELSEQVHELLQRYKVLSQQNEDSIGSRKIKLTNDYEIVFTNDDLINVDKIDFSNDETWLCEGPGDANSKDLNLNRWLYEDTNKPRDIDFHSNNVSILREMSNIKKNIDTRTFTRPKKKFVRPSIEKYNEELYNEIDKKNDDGIFAELQNYWRLSRSITEDSQVTDEDRLRPLHFDLSQPITRDSFDNILNSCVGVDSFQNMSPPSLVNSMCSSTFTNLMENSFIKNDPILREIRDADYSTEILIQDSDPPLFQSFTESCSSLNSDSAENFLRQTLPTLNGTFAKDYALETSRSSNSDNSTLKHEDVSDRSGNLSRSKVSTSDLEIQDNLNNTFKRNVTKDFSSVGLTNNLDLQDEGNTNLNETYQKLKNTDTNEEKNSSDSSITDVYFNTAMSENVPSENIDPNSTIIIHNGTFRKDVKTNSTFSKVPDDKNNTYINNLSDELNRTVGSKTINYNIRDELRGPQPAVEVKRHSATYLTGSTDSLDHMSSLSNSSKGSNRLLNMAEVDAIVELQERSLQVMSTPKPAKSMSKLFETHLISPIVRQKEHVSDSDLSSTDDFLTVRSSLSKGSSGHSEKNLKVLERTVKSLSNLKHNADVRYKPRSINTITKPADSLKTATMADLNLKGSYTNLRTLGNTFKGSYTNLRPIGINLPVISSKPNSAPVSTKNLNVTHTKSDEGFKVPFAPPSNAVKPQPRVSNLPRPVGTGIPRPASKIPGPRSLRPPMSHANVRPLSKASITDGYF